MRISLNHARPRVILMQTPSFFIVQRLGPQLYTVPVVLSQVALLLLLVVARRRIRRRQQRIPLLVVHN